MVKIKSFISNHWMPILTAIILGQSFPFLIIPYLWEKSWVREVVTIEHGPSNAFYIFSILFFLLALSYTNQHALAFWVRYKNNFCLEQIPFTYVDAMFLFIASLTTCLFHREIWGSIHDGVKPLLGFFAAAFFIWLFIIILKGGQKKVTFLITPAKAQNPDFFLDEPITHENEDLFGRSQFVDSLYTQIIKCPLKSHFVFGLHGAWGEGKTSILNLLKNKLHQNDDIIVFNFDPWFFSSRDALVKSFYQGLSSAINKKFFLPNIRGFFNRYHKILSAGLKFSGIDIDINLNPVSLEELRTNIQNWISFTKKKIVILIDDIDRLRDASDVLEILKIVGLSGRFKNTVVVMSFDQIYIKSQLKQLTGDSSFIDKIVQSPFDLPTIEQSDIDKFIYYSFPERGHYSAIDRLFKVLRLDENRIKSFENEFNTLYDTHVRRLFPTLRHAKRYLNGLYTRLPEVKDEVDLRDFLILELIRVFYPGIYNDIRLHPWFYIPSKWDIRMYLLSPFGTHDDGKRYQVIKEHITQITSDKWESDVSLELLQTIFFVEVKNAFKEGGRVNHDEVASTYRSEKRITHPEVFPKYFMLKVPVTDIPDETVESLIKSWNEKSHAGLEVEFIADLKPFQEKDLLVELFRRVFVFLNLLEPVAAKPIIRSMYRNIESLSKRGRENAWQSEYDQAISLLFHLIEKKVEHHEVRDLLVEVINETPSFELAAYVLYFCQKGSTGRFREVYRNVDINHLQGIFSNRMKEHFITGGKDIFEEEASRVMLSQWASDIEAKHEINDYMFSLIEENPKYLGKIIGSFVSDWGPQIGKEIHYDRLLKVYNGPRLYKKVKELYSSAYSTDHEKYSIDLFIRTFEEKNPTLVE